MKNFFEKHSIKIAIWLVSLLIVIGAGLSFYNRTVMSRSLAIKEEAIQTEKEVTKIFNHIQLMDISSRGYALIRTQQFLFWKIKQAKDQNKEIFKNLDRMFKEQGFTGMSNYQKLKTGLEEYTNYYIKMVELLDSGKDQEYLDMLGKDVGVDFWRAYSPFSDDITKFEAERVQKAMEEYEAAVLRNRVVQLLLVIIGLPTLVLILITLRRDERYRKALLLNLANNNKRYLFNDGNEVTNDEKIILESSIYDLQKASAFVNQISHGNYEVQWEGLTQDIAKYNTENLAGRLVVMREQMKKVKEEDQRRIWITEGLASFSDIIRKHQDNFEDLSFKALTYLVKYTNSQQGSFFIVENEEDPYLKLVACYAFDRRKFIEKQIDAGEGIIGQAYLEGKTILMKQLPDAYISITSGLGHATPSTLIIVPLKHNDHVLGLIELASFEQYEPHHVEFLEKSADFIASAISSSLTSGKAKKMMEQMMAQTEQMRAQEEELRQNLEELESTQEEMRRKEIETEKYIDQLKQRLQRESSFSR